MKILVLLIGLALSYTASAQWVVRKVDNGFDEAYKIAYDESKEDPNVLLKLENVDGEMAVYLRGYFCDENPLVEISFLVNGVYDKYNCTTAYTFTDHQALCIIDDIRTSNALDAFKKSSLVKFRITDTSCGTMVYTFSMAGSTYSYNYVLNQ
tara:strand:+ start:1497 stop:1952 length:456 start_codon:yes stop_codon:yes gene_type:complete